MSIHSVTTLAAGLGALLALAPQAEADNFNYYDQREVVVERVTHKYPDYEEREEDEPEMAVEEDEADEDEEVIIEKRVRPRRKKVVVIERYEEPVYVERVHVVRKVYVDPCPPREVVVYHAPRKVIYTSPRVIVRKHGHGYGHGRGHGHGKRHHVSHEGHGHGPRNLFPEGGSRPQRMRGVQQVVAVGGKGHHH